MTIGDILRDPYVRWLVIFAAGILWVDRLAHRGFDQTERMAPAPGAISATLVLLLAIIGVMAACMLSAQISGVYDVAGAYREIYATRIAEEAGR